MWLMHSGPRKLMYSKVTACIRPGFDPPRPARVLGAHTRPDHRVAAAQADFDPLHGHLGGHGGQQVLRRLSEELGVGSLAAWIVDVRFGLGTPPAADRSELAHRLNQPPGHWLESLVHPEQEHQHDE